MQAHIVTMQVKDAKPALLAPVLDSAPSLHTFFVFRTQLGSQQTITGRILRMSNLKDTIHSMLF